MVSTPRSHLTGQPAPTLHGRYYNANSTPGSRVTGECAPPPYLVSVTMPSPSPRHSSVGVFHSDAHIFQSTEPCACFACTNAPTVPILWKLHKFCRGRCQMVGGDLGIANTCYLTISVAAPLIDKPPSWSGFDIKVQLPMRINLADAEMSKL